MTRYLKAAAGASALLVTLALPLAAPATTSESGSQPARFALQTQFYDTRKPGAYLGRMSLNVFPSGIVNGYYFPDDGSVREVTGGASGDKIWFDIAGVPRLHFTGTLRDGNLKAIGSVPTSDTWIFESSSSTRLSG